MIVGNNFEGDCLDNVKYIQHDVYGSMLGIIFDEARKLYVQSAHILNVSTDTLEAIEFNNSFDLRVLQGAHDLIAAYFRYTQATKLHSDLFEQDISEKERIEKMWRNWLREHLITLYSEHVIVRAVCTAVAFENTERGYKAEDLLVKLLKGRYYELNGIEYINKS